MIDLKKLRKYPFRTKGLSITKDDDGSFYNIFFYPENSSFTAAYPKLGIRRMFVRYASILRNKLPYILPNIKTLKHFRTLKLIPVISNKDNIGNIFIDSTQFMTLFERRYRKTPLFRTPNIQNRLMPYFESLKSQFPGRKNVLLYYVDADNDVPKNVFHKRGWQVYHIIRNQIPLFDYILLGIQSGGFTTYYLISSPNDSLTDVRFFSLLRNIRSNDLNDNKKKEQVKSELSERIVSTIESDVEDETEDQTAEKQKVKNIVTKFLDTVDTDKSRKLLHSNDISKDQAAKIAVASTLYSLTKDKNKAVAVANSYQPGTQSAVFSQLKQDVIPSIIDGISYKNQSIDPLMKNVDVHAINDNKNPSVVLNKRKYDFDVTFEKDLFKSFKLLENQDRYPLKVLSFKKEKIPVAEGDLEPSKMVRYIIQLIGDNKKTHEIVIDIPEIQNDGTFMINGQRKYLEYQLVINPIFFIKPKEAELQTSYATVATHHKLTKHKSYYISRIGGYWLPTMVLLFYSCGFEKTCKLFDIDYKIVDSLPDAMKETTSNYFEMVNGKYIIFTSKNPESQLLINSLKECKGKLPSDLTLIESIRDIIISYTQNRNSINVIDVVLKNIMEPIAVQVLKMKMLPTTFEECIHYICKNMAEGKTYVRNDISKQRIRSSEIFNFQIQSMILGSYNQYRRNREHGDNDSVYYCDTRDIVNNVLVQSRLMMPLENINPYEELSCLTRITPVGPGALESMHSVTRAGRNIHESYYGNIDPMDTPENGNVGIINHLTIDAAIGNDRGTFGAHDKSKEINSSILSACTSVIPYISSCDGNRVMMGSSQTRQSVPILGNEQPLCQTGFETIMTNMLTDSYVRKSPVDGEIVNITENVIYIQSYKNRKIVKVILNPELLRSAQGKSSLNYFKPIVKVGLKVSKDQIIAEGKHISGGVISVGTNLLIALMGWKGFSYEDGYIISDRLASKKMASAVFDSVEVMIYSDTIIKQIVEEGTITKKGDPLIVRSSKQIEELLDVEENEFVEGQYIKTSPGGKVISIEVYPNISMKNFPQLEKQFIKFKTKWEETKGKFPDKFLINQGGTKAPFSGIKLVFNIERFDECRIGDKLTNNHGGKGVITLIEKFENMPVTPWGETIDIILNPLAIINRMNPSSLYEMYTGLIAKSMARQLVYLGPKKTQQSLKIIQTVYETMDNTDNKVLSKDIIKSFLSMSEKKYSEYITQLSTNFVMPIIVPPFKQPTKQMIYKTMNYLGLKSKYPLYLPEYKKKTERPVAVGYMYYKKLEQQSEYKVSARSIGKYSETTSQPVAGAKQGGGQRLGEMDTWAFASHGADKVLKELLGPLSDDKVSKDEIISEILQKGEASYREPKRRSTKKILDVYLRGMMLDVDA